VLPREAGELPPTIVAKQRFFKRMLPENTPVLLAKELVIFQQSHHAREKGLILELLVIAFLIIAALTPTY